ncbi:MAG TPA: hopanoid biosynthesis associated radical SAM protein HpnH, partial [Alphaproteobacteria bacterium]|nr:hopanoid biosynthesis associated radical SAM protein HpnH [Alphaproteobacteria bacterium]
KALRVSLKGVNVDGEMAPDISLAKQRKAEYVFSRHVEEAMDQIQREKELAKSGNRPAAAE